MKNSPSIDNGRVNGRRLLRHQDDATQFCLAMRLCNGNVFVNILNAIDVSSSYPRTFLYAVVNIVSREKHISIACPRYFRLRRNHLLLFLQLRYIMQTFYSFLNL